MECDGSVVGKFTPTGASYTALTTNSFTATAGANTLTLVGLDPNGGDNTVFVDQLTLTSSVSLPDANFQSPSVGVGYYDYRYNPTESSWTFTGGSGLAGNASAFTSGNPSAPSGTQVAFLEATGQISQTLSLAAGTYTISLAAAQRGNYQVSSQTFEVLVDGTVVGIFTPSGTSYATFTTGPFTVGLGGHTMSFVGLNPNGGDNTAFISQVAINQPALEDITGVQDPDFLSPGVGTGFSAYQV